MDELSLESVVVEGVLVETVLLRLLLQRLLLLEHLDEMSDEVEQGQEVVDFELVVVPNALQGLVLLVELVVQDLDFIHDDLLGFADDPVLLGGRQAAQVPDVKPVVLQVVHERKPQDPFFLPLAAELFRVVDLQLLFLVRRLFEFVH